MPILTSLLLGLAAGIAISAGIVHLFIGIVRRPRDRVELTFALLSLSIAAFTLAGLALHTASSVPVYVYIFKYFFGPMGIGSFILLMWFVAYYTGIRPRRFLLAMTVWLGLIVVLHVSLPFGFLYSTISGLHSIALPWGERIVIARGEQSPWRLTYDLTQLALSVFFYMAIVRQYRRGDQRKAVMLGLALTLLLAARVVDTLLTLGLIDSILTSGLAFVGVVIAMNLTVSYQVMQTEQELQSHQLHLHDLVAARTAELTRANQQLTYEIQERALVDVALQRSINELTALKRIAEIGMRASDLTIALQNMSEIVTSVFEARMTLIFIPPRPFSNLHVAVGFERGAGALAMAPLEGVLAAMALSTRGAPHEYALITSELSELALPPAVQAFIASNQLHSLMHVSLMIRGLFVGVMAVAADQTRPKFRSDELSLSQTLAGNIAAAIENFQFYQQVVMGRERLTTLYQAAQAISRASLDPDQIYVELHETTARLMPAEAFVIALYDLTNQEVDYVYMVDMEGCWPSERGPLANSFAEYMLRRNASIRIDDFSAFPQTEFAFALFGNQPDTESGVAVLLRGSEQMIGLLFVQSYAKRAYTDADEESLNLLAAHAAIALENARRYRQARELAANEERTRLARELHDSVTQTLFSASLLTEALPRVWERSAGEGALNLAQLRQLVRGALAEMRTLLFELRPAALAAADIGTLLQQLGQVLTGHTHIPVELSIEGQAYVPVDVKIALYRIAQEALNNTAKHSGATHVAITLRSAPGALYLTVRDDGRGFDPAAVPGDRMGIRIMAERAAGIGASLRVDSADCQGTEVSVRWPSAE